MSKFLVDAFTGKVKGTYQFPMDFSVSGHYVIDVPTSLDVRAQSDSAVVLETAKLDAFKALHPSLVAHFNDEFIASPNVDVTESVRYVLGADKRTILFPNGGEIVTGLLAVGTPITTVFPHWHAFTLTPDPAAYPASGPPPPDRLLYNFNPTISAFEEFVPTTFTVEIRDSTNTSTLLTLLPDQEQAFAFAPGSFRIRITNNDPSRLYYMSDWLLLHD